MKQIVFFISNFVTLNKIHQHFMRTFFVQKFIQSQTQNREKLLNSILYEKCARKTSMKLTNKRIQFFLRILFCNFQA
jgi:hypothetical protein